MCGLFLYHFIQRLKPIVCIFKILKSLLGFQVKIQDFLQDFQQIIDPPVHVCYTKELHTNLFK